MDKEDVTNELKNSFKLSLYEAKTYQSLLEGIQTVKSISRDSGVPLPRIYDTLNSLENKGFVKKINKKYIPVEPEMALEGRIIQTKYELDNKLRAQRKVKKEIISVLKRKHSLINEDEQFEILIGLQNIGNKFLEIIKYSKSNCVFGTCAGAIIMSSQCDDKRINNLNILEIQALRNSWGRQINSFEKNIKLLFNDNIFHAKFIRAPKIKILSQNIK